MKTTRLQKISEAILRKSNPGPAITEKDPPRGLMVPLYVYPSHEGQSTWGRLASVICENNLQRNSFVTLNPDNGNFGLTPNDSSSGSDVIPNPDFIKVRDLMRLRKVMLLGYIHTDYGMRSLEIVKDRIRLYRLLYGTDGILFDEMPSKTGMEEYYAYLGKYVKAVGMQHSVGNPGTAINESYVNTLDTLIVYENDGYPPVDILAERTFQGRYARNKFGLILHSLSGYSPEWVKAAAKFAGYFYLTEMSLPNPYSSLSGYLDQLAKEISGD